LTAIEEASNWLYSQYKMLEAKKVADTRDMTIPQIDEVLSELEGAITELENFKNKLYEESGQAKGGQDTTPVQAVGGQTGQGVRVGKEIAAPTQEVVKSENKASEPSKSDKNYQDAQNINSIVSKENPDASVLIQPKGDNLALTAIYVGKGKRRGGIGSKALETIKREAKKLGKKVVLDATNELDQETDLKRLGNFYERNGFKKVGENTYEYDPKNEASSGDTGARTDNTGAEVGDTASATDKGESGKEVIAEAETPPALRDVESTAKALEVADKKHIKGVYDKLKNVFKKSAIGIHASPYKFNKFKLGINAKRGRAYGHGAYISAEKNPTAKNFTLMSISEGIDDLGIDIFEKEGIEIGDNPKYKALSLLQRALVGIKKGEQNDVKSLIEKESKEGPGSSYSGKYNAEDVKLANEYYDKYKSSLKSAYLYEIEYSLDGEMATEEKMSKQSQGVIDALRKLPKEYQNLVDKAIESDMNFNSFYDLLSYNLPKTKEGGINQKMTSELLDEVGIVGQEAGGALLIYNDKKINTLTRKEITIEKGVGDKEDLIDNDTISEAYHKAKADGSNPELVKAVKELLSKEEKKDIKKQEFPKNVLDIAKETGLSPQQIENTYKKYDGSKDVEEITIEDYKNARATGDKAKLEVSAKAFDALLQQENAKTSTSPTAKKNAEKSLKEADEKALKEASKIMEHINEIRAKLQESGIIKSTSCKWGK